MFIPALLLRGAMVAGLSSLRSRWLVPAGKTKPLPTAEIEAEEGDDTAADKGEDYEEAKKEISKQLIMSSTGLGLATLGLYFNPLRLLSVPFTLYTCIPIFRDAYNAAVKEQRLRATMLDTLAISGTLATGYMVLGAGSCFLYWTGSRILLETKNRSESELADIFGQQPRTAWLCIESTGAEVQIAVEDLSVGQLVVVSAGELVPVDGTVIEGKGSVDQRMLTGESQPLERRPGDGVFAATLVLTGRIKIRVEQAGTDTIAAQITDILQHTVDFTKTLETRSQALADRTVLPTLGLTSVALVTRGPVAAVAMVGANYSEVLRVVAPLSLLNFLGIASRSGILIKDGRALEQLASVDTVIFDKTGTLTLEQPHVGQIHLFSNINEDELLTYAAAAEHRQTHPIAKAIVQAAKDRNVSIPNIEASEYQIGFGIKVKINDTDVRIGSRRFMEEEGVAMPDTIGELQEQCSLSGSSLVYVAFDFQLEGAIELRPTVRPEASDVVRQLHGRGIQTYIISGDHEVPTRRLAESLGIGQYAAEVLPKDKADLVAKLQEQGRTTCFVGDGINDSIALKRAHVGVSLKGASTIATDSAQIVLMDQSLNQLTQAFELAYEFQKNLKTSAITTFAPGILVASGILFANLGIVTSVLIYNVSLAAGVTNAMLPKLKRN